jgi:hypothetical protein
MDVGWRTIEDGTRGGSEPAGGHDRDGSRSLA